MSERIAELFGSPPIVDGFFGVGCMGDVWTRLICLWVAGTSNTLGVHRTPGVVGYNLQIFAIFVVPGEYPFVLQ